jgi:hypothetical protein
MSVQQLRAPVVAGSIAAARGAVEAVAAVSTETLDRFELTEAVAELAALESQVAAVKLQMLAEADARRIAEETADTGTDAWAARLTGSTRVAMAGGLWLARLLQEKYDATREAFAGGQINEDQVQVIVRAAEKMPAAATPEQRQAAEEGLVGKAVDGLNSRRLRHAARRMLEVVSKDLADEQEAAQLEDEEESAERETWLTLRDNDDGTVSGKFVIPELHADLLRAALERLSAPRRWVRNKAGEPVEDDTLPSQGPTLPYTERLGAAFTEILEHLPTEGHGRVGATVMVHLDYEHLLNGLGAARLDTGTRISAGEARRLACNAGIVPTVLGGSSEILDLGRERRLHSVGQRRALSVRYDSCAAEGCERPFAWSEIHHPEPWSEGGQTNLGNAVPLCGHHHRRAHDIRYKTSYLPTGEVRYSWRRPRTAKSA